MAELVTHVGQQALAKIFHYLKYPVNGNGIIDYYESKTAVGNVTYPLLT